MAIFEIRATELKQRDDFWYIPGKGCGISTELKYLSKIPENIDGLSCVIIKPSSVSKLNLPECPYINRDIGGKA